MANKYLKIYFQDINLSFNKKKKIIYRLQNENFLIITNKFIKKNKMFKKDSYFSKIQVYQLI